MDITSKSGRHVPSYCAVDARKDAHDYKCVKAALKYTSLPRCSDNCDHDVSVTKCCFDVTLICTRLFYKKNTEEHFNHGFMSTSWENVAAGGYSQFR